MPLSESSAYYIVKFLSPVCLCCWFARQMQVAARKRKWSELESWPGGGRNNRERLERILCVRLRPRAVRIVLEFTRLISWWWGTAPDPFALLSIYPYKGQLDLVALNFNSEIARTRHRDLCSSCHLFTHSGLLYSICYWEGHVYLLGDVEHPNAEGTPLQRLVPEMHFCTRTRRLFSYHIRRHHICNDQLLIQYGNSISEMDDDVWQRWDLS